LDVAIIADEVDAKVVTMTTTANEAEETQE
jgi:hypothetical protein